MAESPTPAKSTSRKPATARKNAATGTTGASGTNGATATTSGAAKTTGTTGLSNDVAATSATGTSGGSSNTAEAKSRFNAALDEAKAGAAALRSEAGERAVAYRNKARTQSEDWVADAKNYGVQAKGRAGDLAVDGKSKIAEAISALGKAIFDTAPTVDEKLGAKYGDYARNASRSLQDASTRLDAKSVEEIGDDAREFVRKSPGLAVGIAAVSGFLLARLFRGSND